MRRTLIGVAASAVTLAAGIMPASAQTEDAPVQVIITEGIGKVCAAAELNSAEKKLYGNAPGRETPGGPVDDREAHCVYPGTEGYDLAVNPGQNTHPQWWEAGYKDGSKFQGLFAPGIGPGANGPYSLTIGSAVAPPGNVCVDSVEGPGCSTRIAGRLTPGPTMGYGAHAGGSHGEGNFTFSSATGVVVNSGTLGWDQSAGTILPLTGEITDGDGEGNQIVGFTSSRGVTGDSSQGNAGVSAATIGFQVEGMLVIYTP